MGRTGRVIVYLGVASVAFGLSNDLRIGRDRLLAALESAVFTGNVVTLMHRYV